MKKNFILVIFFILSILSFFVSCEVIVNEPDSQKPQVTQFTGPSSTTSRQITITSLLGTDNVGIKYWMITEGESANGSWSNTKPTTYTLSTNVSGTYNLYAWAKDAAGNVSDVSSTSHFSVTYTIDSDIPVITQFTGPSITTSATINVTLNGTDNVAITGWYISQDDNVAPEATCICWQSTKPTTYALMGTGTHTLYAWAKDEAGNVSQQNANSSFSITYSGGDTTLPTITQFTGPSTTTTSVINVTLNGTDNVAITGWLINESATKPLSSVAGWASTKPTTYDLLTSGNHTLYAWAKDAAGNVSDANANSSFTVSYTGGSTGFPEGFEGNGSWTGLSSALTWTLSGSPTPTITNANKHSGTYSAKLYTSTDSGSSNIEISTTLSSQKALTLWYKTSTEASYDVLAIYVDGVIVNGVNPGAPDNDSCDPIGNFSGEIDWTKWTYTIASGTHTIKLSYDKDYGYFGGSDTVWIDDISFADVAPAISVSEVSDGSTFSFGNVATNSATERSFTINNTGSATLNITNVALTGNGFTKTFEPVHTISAGGYASLKIKFEPTSEAIYSGSVTITSDASTYIFYLNGVGTVPGTPKWLFMFYVGGDCNLESPMWGDVNEMEKGLYDLQQSNPSAYNNVKIVVLWDGSTGYSSNGPDIGKLYEMGPESIQNTYLGSGTVDVTNTKWWTGDEINMSDGATVTSFLNWAKNRYTGYQYQMLMLSDHGGGARSKGKEIYKAKPRLEKAVVWDDTAGGDSLHTKELATAIANAGYNSSNKLTILGFDACLMAGIEEGYENKDSVSYLAASVEVEQGDGWEYNHWIPQLTSGMSPVELGTLLVNSYKTSFDLMGNDQTFSFSDLSQADNLKTKIDALASGIMSLSAGDKTIVKSYFEGSTKFDGSYSKLIDMGNFCENINSGTISSIKTAATDVYNALGQFVVYAWADSNSGGYYGLGSVVKRGVTIIGASLTGVIPSFYNTTDLSFATTPGWRDVLDAWY